MRQLLLTANGPFGIPASHIVWNSLHGRQLYYGHWYDINNITFSKIFRVKAYCHLLTALSSIITHKLNLWVYNSLLMLLDAVHLYRVYRLLNTLSLLILWTLGHGYLAKDRAQTQNFNKNINCLPNEDVFIEIANTLIQAIFQYF